MFLKLTLQTSQKTLIPSDEILRVDANGAGASVYFYDGSVDVTESLDDIAKLLDKEKDMQALTGLSGLSGVIDAVSPVVSSVTSSLANGTYTVAQVVPIEIVFAEAVTVSGTPQLTLETGATDTVVSYASGSGTTTLTFNYTVATGHTSADLDYASTTALALNGGTIKDASGNSATLTLPTPGSSGSLGANKAIVIDTTGPTVTSVTSTTANGTYGEAAVIAVTITFNETVTVTGTPQLTLETGDTDTAVNYSSGSPGTTLTFNYTVAAGHSSADLDYKSTTALALNGGTIKDAVGNNATLTLASPGAAGSLGANKAIVIETEFDPTTIASLTRWWKADAQVYTDAAGTTLASANDDPVLAWRCQKSSTLASNAISGAVLKTNVINGLPAVLFGATQCLTDAGPYTMSDLIGLNAGHVFLVAKFKNSGAPIRRAFSFQSAANNRVHIANYDDFGATQWGASDPELLDAFPVGYDTGFHVFEVRNASGTGTLRFDGSDFETGALTGVSDSAATTVNIGGIPGGQEWWENIAEILIFKAVLTGTDLTNVRDYITDRYGLTA